jgi:hypothetical protein
VGFETYMFFSLLILNGLFVTKERAVMKSLSNGKHFRQHSKEGLIIFNTDDFATHAISRKLCLPEGKSCICFGSFIYMIKTI